VKNRTRWTFGGVFPQTWSAAHDGAEPALSQAECVLKGGEEGNLHVRVRFLHLIGRDGWQEATPREVSFDAPIGELLHRERRLAFAFGPGREEDNGVVRTHERIEGEVTASACQLDGLIKLTVRMANLTPLVAPADVSRDEAQRFAMASTHAVLRVEGGEFVSLMGPPDEFRSAVEACKNVGVWPVLAGPEGTADTMLASPIILYDYPKVAPESPGDLFDATEIDEILSLRILTLTEDEKQQMREVDERAKRLLDRTEGLSGEQLLGLHGAVRGLRRVSGGESMDFGGLDEPRQALESVRRGHNVLRRGDRVRLAPFRSADSMDMFLAGKIAVIESIEEDFEGRIHLAVTVEDDPGKDLGSTGKPGHRFFFRPEEVEPLGPTEKSE
jgi:hypothetical protein